MRLAASLPWFLSLICSLFASLSLNACGGGGGGGGTANRPPEASLTVTPQAGGTPLTVAFDASASSDPDGSIASYAWDFGDGATAEGVTATHTYDAQGTYEATLRVVDDRGAETTRSVTITAVGPPIVAPPDPVVTTETVTLRVATLPGASLQVENRRAARAVAAEAPQGWVEVPVTLAVGTNEIRLAATAAGVTGPATTVTVTRIAATTLTLEAAEPGHAMAGGLLRLRGAGFGSDPGGVRVYFRSRAWSGDPEEVESLNVPAPVLEVTDTEIRTVVPFAYLRGGEAEILVVRGDEASAPLSFIIDPAADPTPGVSESEEFLDLASDQLTQLAGLLGDLAGQGLPEEDLEGFRQGLSTLGDKILTLKGRLATVSDPEVRNQIEALFASEAVREAIDQLREANGRLADLTSAARRAGRLAPDGTPTPPTPCVVAEVVEVLQDIREPIGVLNSVLDATLGAIDGLLAASAVGCFFGVVPACTAIPFLVEAHSVVAAVDGIVNAVLSVLDTAITVLQAEVPQYPSEWKLVVTHPVPGLANDVFYTGWDHTLEVYVNLTNAPFRELLHERDTFHVDIPDPYGVLWLVKQITGTDLEEMISDLLQDLVLEIVADIVWPGGNRATEVDLSVPFTVQVAEGQGLVTVDNSGSAEAHVLTAGSQPGMVGLDVRALCGVYSFPDRTKCLNLDEDTCTEWGTDYPSIQPAEVLDKPRIDSVGDWTPDVYVDTVAYNRCTRDGVRLCTLDEFKGYISQLCSDLPESNAQCRLFDACYDPEIDADRCSIDDYEAMLDALCAEDPLACNNLIHTTYGVSYDYGYWQVTGKGFSTTETHLFWNPGAQGEFLNAGSLTPSQFLLYANPFLGRAKPGWLQVIVGTGENERRSDVVFLEPSPNLSPEIRVLNPDVYPGDRLYVEANYLTPVPDDIVLSDIGTSLSWQPDPFPLAGGFSDPWGIAWFTGPGASLPEGHHSFTLAVGPDPGCPGLRCTTGTFEVLPHRRADDADVVLTGPRAFMSPRAVAVGDFNGDGLPDLAVGVPTYTNFYELGAVFLLFGKSENWGDLDLGDETAWDVRILGDSRDLDPGTRNTRRIGNALAAGDLNGDGIDDLVIGSTDRNPDTGTHGTRLDPGGAHLPGKAYVMFGRPSWDPEYSFTLDQYDVRFVGAAERELGEAVAVGRIGSSDQRADLVLGAPSVFRDEADADPGPGRVYVIRGWGFTLPDKTVNLPSELMVFPYAATLEGAAEPFSSVLSYAGGEVAETRADRFGASLAVADVDGDGLGDLVIGAPAYAQVTSSDPLEAREGAVYLFRGRSWFGPPGTALGGTLHADALAGGDQDAALLGPPVTSDGEHTGFGRVVHAGDLTGDGRAEVILGAPEAPLEMAVGALDLERERAGRVYLLEATNDALSSGAAANVDEAADLTVHGSNRFVRLGHALASGDLNRDGFSDLVVGAPGDRADENPGRVWILWGSDSPPWRAPGHDVLYLETRSWQTASSGAAHLADGEDYAYLGSGDSSALAPRFGAAVAVVDLPPNVGADLVVVDAGADVPDAAETDGVRRGAGQVFGFFGAGAEAFLARPVIGAKPWALDLGTLPPGQGASRSIRIRNDATGAARDLEIQAIELTGDPGFSLDLALSLPLTLAPGGEEEIRLDILFTGAAEPGEYRATLVVTSDDPFTPRLAIPLTAVVSEAFPTVSVGDVTFEAREFTKILRIENQGTADLTWTLEHDWYQGKPWPGWLTASETEGTTAPGEAAEINLTVDRSGLDLGTHVYTLYVSSNDPNAPSVPVMVVVKVGPLPDIAVDPSALDFEIRPGWNVTNRVRVSNESDADLTISGITLSPETGDFYRWNPDDACGPPLTLGPGETCSVGIGFARTSEGTSTATLTLTTDDPDEPVLEIPLTGTASIPQEPDISVIGANAVFGGVPIGSTRTWDITVKNEGVVDLHVEDVTVTGAPEFALVSNGCTDPVPPFTGGLSQMCTITVSFTPAGTDVVTGEIRISSDDPDEPVVTGTLSGAGITPSLSVSPTLVDLGDTDFTAAFALENLSQTETLEWSVEGDLPNWLGVSPNSGQLAPGSSADVVLTADRTGLSEGTYSHALSITSSGGDATVTVSMNVPTPFATFASPDYSREGVDKRTGTL